MWKLQWQQKQIKKKNLLSVHKIVQMNTEARWGWGVNLSRCSFSCTATVDQSNLDAFDPLKKHNSIKSKADQQWELSDRCFGCWRTGFLTAGSRPAAPCKRNILGVTILTFVYRNRNTPPIRRLLSRVFVVLLLRAVDVKHGVGITQIGPFRLFLPLLLLIFILALREFLQNTAVDLVWTVVFLVCQLLILVLLRLVLLFFRVWCITCGNRTFGSLDANSQAWTWGDKKVCLYTWCWWPYLCNSGDPYPGISSFPFPSGIASSPTVCRRHLGRTCFSWAAYGTWTTHRFTHTNSDVSSK